MKRERTGTRWIGVAGLLAATLAVGNAAPDSLLRALWPAIVALGAILLLREAALGLACGVAAGVLLLTGGDPVAALRIGLADHIFPAMQGPWRVGALVFTLLLGAFAGVLERSGGFATLLERAMQGGRDVRKRLLGGVYGLGLLCFFDGLANSLLLGRIARPLADRSGVSREKLAWVVDSTSSPVACVAFISTWIATQLSLIDQGLQGAPFPVEPYGMFFASVPANAYCLLTLLLVPLAIRSGWEPRAMRRFQPVAADEVGSTPRDHPPARVVLLPLAALVTGILAGFPLLSKEPVNVLSAAGWRTAFSGDGGPYALVFGALVGLAAAMIAFPAKRRHEAAEAAVHGAGTLLPALLVLVLAWSLGSVFEALGAADRIASLLATSVAVPWLPAVVFLTGAAMSFATGSSWGTMGLLMPLALPATLAAGTAAGMPSDALQALAPMVIGAVFGGAVFGDHCSPFSDTTIVSAMAAGCRPMDHVTSQLPFAAIAAFLALAAYALMALGLAPWLATTVCGAALAGWQLTRRKVTA
jgi:Na+/H+ antiporter NhaC